MTETFLRVLGEELRSVRRQRGWTLVQVVPRLVPQVSPHTLATWEQGTRHCSVERFVGLCGVLEEPADVLLGRVLQRLAGPAAGLQVDLAAVVRDDCAELATLRRWARARLVRGSTSVRLEFAALERMAELCGIPTTTLIARLIDLRHPT